MEQIQWAVFILNISTLLLSIYIFANRDSKKLSLFFLFLSSLILNLMSTSFSGFLHVWDERFHALVAKNLMSDPLQPMLYAEKVISSTNYNSWINDTIWLHKQPLFLWQIALSFKLFGVHEFALRLPSAIMASIIVVLLVYVIGKILGQRIGYITGLLVMSSFTVISLVSGRQGMDHNDLAFWFYVSLSILMLMLYIQKPGFSLALLVGLFSGAAVLCKWLSGLVVFSGYFMYIVLLLKSRELKTEHLYHFIGACFVCLIVFVPWHWYILSNFPDIAAREYSLNTKHFFEVIEGHSGDGYYYLDQIKNQYGYFSIFFILLGILQLYYRAPSIRIFLPLLTIVSVNYVFFSISKTKLPMYSFNVSVIMFVFLACAMDHFISIFKIHQSRILLAMSLLLVCVMNFRYPRFKSEHLENGYVKAMTLNTEFYKSLDSIPNRSVIFNVRGFHYVDIMFYTKHMAYNFVPTPEQMEEVRSKGWDVILINPGMIPHLTEFNSLCRIIPYDETPTAE